ncbi:hypothetical protein VUR80DRAFT_3402 [Thermomyces stellatus]
MSSRGPGANSRGRGGKFRKFTRGGGKHFSRDLRPVDADGNEISMWSEDAQRQIRSSGVSESGSASESEEESGSESEREGGATATAALSREDRKKEKKARKEAAIARKKAQAVEVGDLPPSDDDDSEDDGPMPANPNHSKAARDMVGEVTDRVEKMGVGGNRRERESAEAAAAREKYRMLHEQGKTEEAKADLARLKVIREQREAERARKQAEKEEKEAEAAARKAEREAKLAAINAKKGGKKK